ncbi:hypothetical protein TorRG33x02_354340, partial [Trema orientale]
ARRYTAMPLSCWWPRPPMGTRVTPPKELFELGQGPPWAPGSLPLRSFLSF